MLKLICFSLVVLTVQGHTDKLKTDGELQSALMPQELNPAFVSEKDWPMRAFLPLDRVPRDTDLTDSPATVNLSCVKRYTRIIACVVLAVSAVVEIVLYLIEYYYGSSLN